MTLERDGAERHAGLARDTLPALRALADGRVIHGGVRLYGEPSVRAVLAADTPVGALIAQLLGPTARPVRALLFDKRPGANWALGWHQDRVISVVERRDVAGFGPWTVKHGAPHVQPPFAVLAAMLTVRIHLDDTAADNAPLLVAPGSHRHGRIAEDAIAATVATCGVRACLAEAGDVWCYATPILHASDRARTVRRRVLQVDFSAAELPGGLAFAGV